MGLKSERLCNKVECSLKADGFMDRGCLVFIDRENYPPTISRVKETSEWGILLNNVNYGDARCRDECNIGMADNTILMDGWIKTDITECDDEPNLNDIIYYNIQTQKFTCQKTKIRVGLLVNRYGYWWKISLEK